MLTPEPTPESPKSTPVRLSRTAIMAISAGIVIILAAYLARPERSMAPSATASPVASAIETATPAATAAVTPSASPAATASPSPTATSDTRTYASTADKLSFSYPSKYHVIDSANDAGVIVQGQYVAISDDPSLSVIQVGACVQPYIISPIHAATPFSDFAKPSSWPFIDAPSVTSLTVGGYPAYQVTGTYNSQGLSTNAGAPARITLVNAPVPLQMVACLKPGAAVNAAEYDGIVQSFVLGK